MKRMQLYPRAVRVRPLWDERHYNECEPPEEMNYPGAARMTQGLDTIFW